MKYDRIYFLFIGAAVFFHIIAFCLTYYGIEVVGTLRECNQIMASQFSISGYITTSVLTTLLLAGAFFIMPFLMRQSEKIGMKTALGMGTGVFIMALDAYHDFFVITDNPLGNVTFSVMKILLIIISTITGTSPTC